MPDADDDILQTAPSSKDQAQLLARLAGQLHESGDTASAENPAGTSPETVTEIARWLVESESLTAQELDRLQEFAERLASEIRAVRTEPPVSESSGKVDPPERAYELAALSSGLERPSSRSHTKSRRSSSHSEKSRDKRRASRGGNQSAKSAPTTVMSVIHYWLRWQVLLGLAAVCGIAIAPFTPWFNGSASSSSFESSTTAPDGTPENQSLTPEELSEHWQGIWQFAKQGKFDEANGLIKARYGQDASLESSDPNQRYAQTALLLAQGGQAAWGRAGDSLIARHDLRSPTWRLLFATWLVYSDSTQRDLVAEVLATAPDKRPSARFRMKAWVQARNGQHKYASTVLSKVPLDECEPGDLLFRATASAYTNQTERAAEDLAQLQSELRREMAQVRDAGAVQGPEQLVRLLCSIPLINSAELLHKRVHGDG